MQRKHIFAFISILILSGLVWAWLYFWTEQTTSPNEMYGVVQTVNTKPSSQALLQAYYTSVQSLADKIVTTEDCTAAMHMAASGLQEARVPKEFLDIHLEAFFSIKQMASGQSCHDNMQQTLRDLAYTVTSTPL